MSLPRATELFGAPLASELGESHATLVRLLGASGELVGVLFLGDREQRLAEEDNQVLHAIAGHAAVALENARLFTRMDQANRHWVEIFDAISDFIVAHDEAGNVLRVNRSLAEFIGVQPQALIGVNMSALLTMGDAPPLRACPFCRTTTEGDDEYVHPVLERTYLVSTSRVHGASSEGMQTIHVLKDISDRLEVEQRYRELFDNIQEGLFFSTPDGRFIEVNDALVRMLGYGSREDLLQVDVRTQVYFSAEGHQELARRNGRARRGAKPRGDAPPPRRIGSLCTHQCLRGARRPGPGDAVPRPDAGYQRAEKLPGGVAARARLLRQDPEQHPKPDPGGRHRRTDQLRQPPLAGHGLRTEAVAGAASGSTWWRRPGAPF